MGTSSDALRRTYEALQTINEALLKKVEKADALSDLGPGAPYLTKDQFDKALGFLIGFKDGQEATRVAKFVAHMPNLTEAQCELILRFFTGGDANALAEVGPVLAHFSDDQRRRLFGAANGFAAPRHRRIALVNLGAAGLAGFTDEERSTIIDAVLGSESSQLKADRIVQVAPQMAHFSDDQRQRLFQAANGFADRRDRRKALVGLGAGGMADFTEQERSTIIDAVLGSENSELLATGIIEVSPQMEHFNGAQKTRLIDAIVNMGDRLNKAKTLGAVSKEMANLDASSEDRRRNRTVWWS